MASSEYFSTEREEAADIWRQIANGGPNSYSDIPFSAGFRTTFINGGGEHHEALLLLRSYFRADSWWIEDVTARKIILVPRARILPPQEAEPPVHHEEPEPDHERAQALLINRRTHAIPAFPPPFTRGARMMYENEGALPREVTLLMPSELHPGGWWVGESYYSVFLVSESELRPLVG